MSKPSVQFFAFSAAIAKELKTKIADMVSGTAKPEPAPSVYQQAIFDWVATGTGSAVVMARAGTGKTTTALAALRRISEVDLSYVRAGTFHSVGYSAVIQRLKAQGVKCGDPDSLKCSKLARTLFADDAERDMYGSFVTKLVGLAKGEGIGILLHDVIDHWLDLVSHHDLTLDDARADERVAVDFARRLLVLSNAEAAKGNIDFDDQLYLPLLWKLKLWQNDFVIIDEAQDTNPVRRAIAKLALRPGGRLLAVGDDRQAIFGFTGASHDALDLIRAEFNCIELPLTICYRCSKAVVENARSIVADLEVAPNAVEGSVQSLKLKDALKVLTQKDAILCRQNAPLVELAFRIIASGRGCTVIGRDIGKSLVILIEKQRAKGIDNLISKLDVYRTRETAKFIAKGEEGKAEAVNDRVDCINTVIATLVETNRTIPALISKLSDLFTDNGDGVLALSSLHKAKGKEWDHVALYRPDLLPSKWARQEWQAKQESNLDYVGRTRARIDYIEITDDQL